MKKTAVLLAVLLCFAQAGCAKKQKTAQPSAGPAAQTQVQESGAPQASQAAGGAETAGAETITDKKVKKMDAADLVAALEKKGLPVGDVKVYNKSNDPSGKLGKAGQYASKTAFTDTRLAAEGEKTVDVCGIEVFKNAEDAKARRDQIETVTADSILMQEYIFRFDTILLRLPGQLSLEEAQGYANALQEITGVAVDTNSTTDLKQAAADFMAETQKAFSGE